MQRSVLYNSQQQNPLYEAETPAGESCSLLSSYCIFIRGLHEGQNKVWTYKISTPVYEVLSKFRESIKSQPAIDIDVADKITVDGNFIFLSEPLKGIHVIDNSNPSSPKMFPL